MGRLGRWLFIATIAVIVALALVVTFTIGWRPFIGPRTRPLTARKFDRTPQRLERGRYIATALSGCIYCHSSHRWSDPSQSIVSGTEGAGEVLPYRDLPGRIVAPNLTPDAATGAGNWTDDQLARAIREGIGHDGRALFPIMPYTHYRAMSDEDLASVIVFLRSLPPVHNELPKTEIIFPVKYLIRSVPEPLTSPVVADTNTSDLVQLGARLVDLAGCIDCHTPMVRGAFLPGLEFAGGQVFSGPWPTVASANITPDASGIPYYDEALFLEVMHTGFVHARPLSPVMPVSVYRNLTDSDLKAIFAFLRTVKPVKHEVDNSEPPTQCKVCKQKHGAGDRN